MADPPATKIALYSAHRDAFASLRLRREYGPPPLAPQRKCSNACRPFDDALSGGRDASQADICRPSTPGRPAFDTDKAGVASAQPGLSEPRVTTDCSNVNSDPHHRRKQQRALTSLLCARLDAADERATERAKPTGVEPDNLPRGWRNLAPRFQP